MLTIDGSKGEGGGQVLRTTLSMAVLLEREVRIEKIRAGRSTPGLAAAHLTAVRAAAAVCGAEVEGAEMGSEQVTFRPSSTRGGSYEFDVGTAGSTTLVLQTILPPLLLAPGTSYARIHGGTNVLWSPPQEYFAHVFLPAIAAMGARVAFECLAPGFYPRGGGLIEARITPLENPLRPLLWQDRGEFQSLQAFSVASESLPDHITARQIKGAREALGSTGLSEQRSHPRSLSPGTMLMIAAGFERGRAGFTAHGERGRPAEKVGREAGREAAAFLDGKASVDEHLADQLVIYGAMAGKESGYRTAKVTEHLRTNLSTVRQFLEIDMDVDDTDGSVRICGAGLRPAKRRGSSTR